MKTTANLFIPFYINAVSLNEMAIKVCRIICVQLYQGFRDVGNFMDMKNCLLSRKSTKTSVLCETMEM